MAQRKIQGFSLRPAVLDAVRVLAEEKDGGNKSRFVARLVRDAAERRFGKDWEVIVSQPSPAKEEAAA